MTRCCSMAAKSRRYARRAGEPRSKVCFTCGAKKPIAKFPLRRMRGPLVRLGRCRTCFNAYHVDRRKTDSGALAKHNALMRKVRRRRVERTTEFLRSIKKRPCTDCGFRFNPWQMQFDHVRGRKLFVIASSGADVSVSKLRREIAKCEVVCANCHAERTYRRLHGLPISYGQASIA